jgi:tetratricopeptide (TPR) repeat protein
MAQTTLRDYLQAAEDAIGAGRTDDAVAKCQNILAQYPEALEVQRLLGEAYLARENFEDAQRAFDWVLTNDPENVVAYCDRALISERLSDYDTALDCYQQAYELSRGNSQIRSEFNKLSARVGQQGFMFSRAGLARLYMRGNLLTQAVQEWENVLAASPDRLDARTGILETYWLEGSYDQVEQLAIQILEDVPGCLKVLLLLAHVMSAKNVQRASELLRQAQALDPGMLMAQELFADYKAAHKSDPFFQLLPETPVKLDVPDGVVHQVTSSSPSQPQIASAPAAYQSQSENSPWNGLDTWGKGDSHSAPLVASAPEKASDLPIWGTSSILGLDMPPRQESPDFARAVDVNHEHEFSTWDAMQQSGPHAAQPEQPFAEPQEAPHAEQSTIAGGTPSEAPTWMDQHQFSGSDLSGVNAWNEQASDVWGASSIESASVPSAWLDMLTQQERQQLSDIAPATHQAPTAEEQVQHDLFAQEQQPDTVPQPADEPFAQAAEIENSQQAQQAAAEHALPIVDDDEEEKSFFGPEWLKSLGATTIEPEDSEEVAAPVAKVEAASEAPMMIAEQPAPQPQKQPDEQQDADSAARAEQERKALASLEEIEQGLRAQGFVSLEPNSLSSLSQSGAPAAYNEQQAAYSAAEEAAPASSAYQDGNLSAALAELGNLRSQQEPNAASEHSVQQASTVSNASNVVPDQIARHEDQEQSNTEEPDWVAALRSTPASSSEQSFDLPDWAKILQAAPTSAMPDQQNGQPAEPEWMHLLQQSQEPQATPAPMSPTLQEQQLQKTSDLAPEKVRTTAPLSNGMQSSPFAYEQRANNTSFEPVANVPSVSQPGVLRPDPLLDNELETTMRRPAIRLQHMQTRPSQQRGVITKGQGHTSERVAGTNKASNEQMNARDRLLTGYQYQLAGDYDAAMQEYRVIIKGSSELLSEVVSNVRALLKLAPKYAAGYRVLGDAYMRQGEYLQAMEAYNKALTMAKKARG